MKVIFAATVTSIFIAGAAQSAVIYADTVIDYFSPYVDYADGFGHGGLPNGTTVPLSFATDGDFDTYVSLRTNEFITLGFSTGYIFDGVGDDLFIHETGDADELAELWVSDDWGQSFTAFGTINGNQTNSIDFADFGYTGTVNALKIIGLDARGASPGFDVASVWGLDGSTVEEPQLPAVPVPATLPLLLTAGGLLGLLRRKAG